MHRVKVRVVEDALDANNTIARANRDDFDRHDVTVDDEEIVVGEFGELEALRPGPSVRDNVTAHLEHVLQSPTHPIVAAGNQGKRRTFNGQLH